MANQGFDQDNVDMMDLPFDDNADSQRSPNITMGMGMSAGILAQLGQQGQQGQQYDRDWEEAYHLYPAIARSLPRPELTCSF